LLYKNKVQSKVISKNNYGASIRQEQDDKRRKIKQERFFDSDMVNWGKKIKHREKKNRRKINENKEII
jgi:hypothetical protein